MGSDRLRSWLSCRFFRSQGSPDAIVMGIILLCAHQSRKVFALRYLPSPTVQYHSHRSNSRMFISHFDHSPDSPGSIPSTHFTLLNHNSRHADPGPQTSPQLHIKPHKLNHTIYMTQRPGSQYTVSTVYSISMCVCSYWTCHHLFNLFHATRQTLLFCMWRCFVLGGTDGSCVPGWLHRVGCGLIRLYVRT